MATTRTPLVPTPAVDVRRAGERFHTRMPGWTRTTLQLRPHYDPANSGHGLLLVNNDEGAAGTGFSTHPTRTWRS